MRFALTKQPGGQFRQSANTSLLSKVFDKVSGRRSTLSGFGHPSGDPAGVDDALRTENSTKIFD